MSGHEWLNRELVTRAWTWMIERADGVRLGFTSHDRDIDAGGVRYRAAPGLKPGALQLTASLDPDTIDVEGAIADGALSARDLAQGRWDGARVSIGVLDWEAPDSAPLLLATGELGAVEQAGETFTAEMRGPGAALSETLNPETSPGCRARLGDARCRVDLTGRRHRVAVIAVEGNRATIDAQFGEGSFARGSLIWLSGAQCGLRSTVLASSGEHLDLVEMPRGLDLPARVELTEGCDGRIATCRDRFGNAVNFRGEPHLPGMDLLTRYPGA